MIAPLLALGSSLAYGCADFLGGLGARQAHVPRTVMIAAPASFTVELLLRPFLGPHRRPLQELTPRPSPTPASSSRTDPL